MGWRILRRVTEHGQPYEELAGEDRADG